MCMFATQTFQPKNDENQCVCPKLWFSLSDLNYWPLGFILCDNNLHHSLDDLSNL